MLDPVVIQGIQPGGQLTITTDVENWPGDDLVLGPDLMIRMASHARSTGAEIIADYIDEIDLDSRPFAAVGDGGTTYLADAVILATGAQARWLGLPSESFYKGFGVSACATCDGFFYRNRDVAVVGGGNTAAEEALFLTKFANKVTVVHRRTSLRADKVLQKRLFENPRIAFAWDHVVDEVLGTPEPKSVTGLRIRHVRTGDARILDCSGVFIAIGHVPSSELVANQLTMHSGGYVKVGPESTATSVPGVFAAGDITDNIYRQAVTSAGMGCMAALDAEKFLSEEGLA